MYPYIYVRTHERNAYAYERDPLAHMSRTSCCAISVQARIPPQMLKKDTTDLNNVSVDVAPLVCKLYLIFKKLNALHCVSENRHQ